MLIIYRPASEQRFYLVFISDIILVHTKKQSSKFDCVCVYHVIIERRLPPLIMYCRQFKYTCYIALMYTLKIIYKKVKNVFQIKYIFKN